MVEYFPHACQLALAKHLTRTKRASQKVLFLASVNWAAKVDGRTLKGAVARWGEEECE